MIENATPTIAGRKTITVRRAINRSVALVPGKQVIAVEGVLMPHYNSEKGSWAQPLFAKREPETALARMIVKLTPVSDSDAPVINSNPDRVPPADSEKSSIALGPTPEAKTPDFIVIRNPKKH